MTSGNEDWQKISNAIISELMNVKSEDQLSFMKSKILLLPPEQQEIVEHFVALGVFVGGNIVKAQGQTEMSRHRHISGIVAMGLFVAIALVIGAIYLIWLIGPQASSKIEMWGANIETDHLGIGCFFLATVIVVLVIRKALSRI